jgi:hypothetical protein
LGAGAAGASSAIGAGASGARSGSDIPARRATEAALKTLDLFLAEPSGLCGGGREPARFQRRAADGFTPRSSRGSSAGSSPEPRVPIDRCDPSRLGRSSDPDPGSLSRPSRGIVRGAAAETRSKRSRSRDHSKKARAERWRLVGKKEWGESWVCEPCFRVSLGPVNYRSILTVQRRGGNRVRRIRHLS